MFKVEKVVSVCIPVYNGAEHIAETIESVLHQKYKFLEIIVLDNNSKDSTNKIVSKYVKSDSRIKLFKNKKTVDMGDNWNSCVDYATGDFIMLLSADDLLLPEFISEGMKVFLEKKVEVFSANHLLFNSKMERNRRINIKEDIYENYTSLILLKNPFSINFSIFTKEAISLMKSLNQGKLFKHYYTCDYDLWIRSSNHLKIYFSSKILGKYRMHENNLSNDKNRMYKETIQVLTDNKALLIEKCPFVYFLTISRIKLKKNL